MPDLQVVVLVLSCPGWSL